MGHSTCPSCGAHVSLTLVAPAAPRKTPPERPSAIAAEPEGWTTSADELDGEDQPQMVEHSATPNTWWSAKK